MAQCDFTPDSQWYELVVQDPELPEYPTHGDFLWWLHWPERFVTPTDPLDIADGDPRFINNPTSWALYSEERW